MDLAALRECGRVARDSFIGALHSRCLTMLSMTNLAGPNNGGLSVRGFNKRPKRRGEERDKFRWIKVSSYVKFDVIMLLIIVVIGDDFFFFQWPLGFDCLVKSDNVNSTSANINVSHRESIPFVSICRSQ